MSARRGTTEYNDGCRAFVAFAVSKCTAVDGKIYYPCKYCRNNQRHAPDYVLAHLTGGRGMSPGYNFGICTVRPRAGLLFLVSVRVILVAQIRLPVALNRVNSQNKGG
jgi:hypothetical protein